MNILFLIGNGFDLNLGLKTRYRDFYKYYFSIPNNIEVIKKMKYAISKDIENWSDLELALGKYTINFKSESEFIEAYDNLCDSLADYLQMEEDKFDFNFNNLNREKLLNYFISPESSLPPGDKIPIFNRKKGYNDPQHDVYIITYNYTNSLEKLLDYKHDSLHLGSFLRSKVTLQRLEHVHGYIQERMVLGVNDASQISNMNFKKNKRILLDLVKTDCNQAQKHLIDEWAKEQIMKSNLICIFGSSLGDTDNIWWELIGERLKEDCILIIFHKGEVISTRRPQRKVLTEMEIKNYFIRKTLLNENEIVNVLEKIYVGINTNMFDLK